MAAQPLLAGDTTLLEETRTAALPLLAELSAELQKEMLKGQDSAVVVCKDIAPFKVGVLSRATGWRITRVSLKVRNPLLGSPDAWERAALADFDKRAAAGESVAKLETSAVVTEGSARYFRYIKALPVQPLCVHCHGSETDIPPAVKAKITAEYPHDNALGYSAGQVRGGLSVKRPL